MWPEKDRLGNVIWSMVRAGFTVELSSSGVGVMVMVGKKERCRMQHVGNLDLEEITIEAVVIQLEQMWRGWVE